MGVIIFANQSSKDVGIEVETFPTYNIAEKEYTAVHVPGRNGDVIIDNGTYRNTQRQYRVSIATYDTSYHQKMAAVAKWLHSSTGYSRLEDSYEPDFFFQAYYKESVSIENLFNEAGRATLTFECKPQRFLKSGDLPIIFTSGSTTQIRNSTTQISLPLIEVTTDNSQGVVSINGVRVTILANSGTNIIIDSELQDAYNNQDVNKNPFIVLNDGELPTLRPGINSIAFSGGVQSISLKPRWWVI